MQGHISVYYVCCTLLGAKNTYLDIDTIWKMDGNGFQTKQEFNLCFDKFS